MLAGILSAAVSNSSYAEEAPVQNNISSQDEQSPKGTFDIETNPLVLLIGMYGGDVGIGVSDRITLGPTFYYINYSPTMIFTNSNFNGYRAGAQATFYLTGPRFSNSWIASTEVSYISLKYTGRDTFLSSILGADPTRYEAEFSGVGAAAVIGYQWNFDSGINLTLAAGVQAYNIAKSQMVNSSAGGSSSVDIPEFAGVGLAGRFGVGYVF